MFGTKISLSKTLFIGRNPKSRSVLYSRRMCVDQLEVVIFVSPRFLDRITGFYRVITPSYIFFFFPLEERRHNQRSYPRRASRLSNRPIFFAICKHSRLLTWRFPLSLALFRTVGGKRSFRNTRLSPIRDLMIVQPWKALFFSPTKINRLPRPFLFPLCKYFARGRTWISKNRLGSVGMLREKIEFLCDLFASERYIYIYIYESQKWAFI